jgi:hypothetical protein
LRGYARNHGARGQRLCGENEVFYHDKTRVERWQNFRFCFFHTFPDTLPLACGPATGIFPRFEGPTMDGNWKSTVQGGATLTDWVCKPKPRARDPTRKSSRERKVCNSLHAPVRRRRPLCF